MNVVCFQICWILSACLIQEAILVQVFDTLPKDREVNPGEVIAIPCKVRNRKGECAWLKDGVVVGKIPDKYTFNREPDDGDCGITISNTQLEDDDGLWQCQVTQASMQELTLTSPEVRLTVREAPYPPIIEDSTIQIMQGDPFTARAGETKRLHCLARKGNPPAVLKWFLNDVEITTSVNQTSVMDVEKRKTWQAVSALDFTFEKKDNHKILKCVSIHDAYDTRSKAITVRLEILYPPEISLEGKPKEEIVEGMSLPLRCRADANPKANIIWRKSGHSGIYDIKDHIEFNPIRRTDSGIYSCSAKNDIGQSEEMEITVDVKFKPKINRVYPSPRMTVALYQPTKLICDAEGNPPPRYSWLQRIGGDPVIWQERASNSTLYIHNITYSYQGIYLCQASNVINGVLNTLKSEEIFVDVTGPPQVLLDIPTVSNHMVVDKDENAVIVVFFCADPRPKKTFWEWGNVELDTNAEILRHTAEALQPVSMREDCYEARLIVTNVEGSDSRTYSFIIENEKGRETFTVALEVREPFALTIMVGSAVVVVMILILLTVLLVYLIKREKCCFNHSSGFKPASESIMENGCPSDTEKSEITTPKTGKFNAEANKTGSNRSTIATIGEETYYKGSKKADRNDNKDSVGFGSLDSFPQDSEARNQMNCRKVHPQYHGSSNQCTDYQYQNQSVEQAYI